MTTQDNHNTAIAKTENDLPPEGTDVLTDQDVEVTEETDTAREDTASASTAKTEPDAEPAADVQLAWSFPLTSDSTALNAITQIIVEDDGGLLGGAPDLPERLEGFLNGDTEFANDKEKLNAAQDLLREFTTNYNRSWSGIVGTFTDYAVQIGRLLHILKSLVKSVLGEKWEVWAGANLKFMTPRTRQSYMQLAKVPGIDNHLHFGIQRLLPLAGATKGAGGDDPIGDFLKKYNLGFDPEAEIDLDAYKDAVDLALDFERLKKADLNVDMEALQMFKADGKKVGASLIETLKIVEKAGGDPNKYLREPNDDHDASIDGKKKAQSFQKIAITLAGTIEWLSSHEEFAKDVDVTKIDELVVKLAELKNRINASGSPEADD